MIKIVLNSQALFTYLKIGFLILFIAFKMNDYDRKKKNDYDN